MLHIDSPNAPDQNRSNPSDRLSDCRSGKSLPSNEKLYEGKEETYARLLNETANTLNEKQISSQISKTTPMTCENVTITNVEMVEKHPVEVVVSVYVKLHINILISVFSHCICGPVCCV